MNIDTDTYFNYVKCKKCSFVFTNPRLKEKYIFFNYNEGKKKNEVYKTYEGKDYNYYEWQEFDEKQYEEYCKRTGRPYTPRTLEKPKENSRKFSFLADDNDNFKK